MDFVYNARTNTVYVNGNQEMSKHDWRKFLINAKVCFGYVPLLNADENAPYALQKRCFFRWLIRKNNIATFAMVSEVYYYGDDHAYCIEMSPACGYLIDL